MFLCTGVEYDKPSPSEPAPDLKTESTLANVLVDVNQVKSAVCEVSNEVIEEREVKQEVQLTNGSTSHGTIANEGTTNGYHCELDKEGSVAVLQMGHPVFLIKSWRAQLCRCPNCLRMYEEKGIGFLLYSDDTLQVLPQLFFTKKR